LLPHVICQFTDVPDDFAASIISAIALADYKAQQPRKEPSLVISNVRTATLCWAEIWQRNTDRKTERKEGKESDFRLSIKIEYIMFDTDVLNIEFTAATI
jgi:hypothetical protein